MLAQNGDALQGLESIRLLFNLTIVAGIVGAIVDHRYKKSGGVKPTRRHWIYLFTGACVCVALLAFLGFSGADPEWIGRRLWDSAALLFVIWEFSRWLMRRSHPLNRPT
jgi:hypothetical protein